VVIQSGHILLVRRKAEPGRGLWALPGGFVGQEELLYDSCIRELREETGLKVPEKVLQGSMFKKDVFDRPDRSTRGRTITHAFYFKLDDLQPLPHIKGGDDAEKARWVPLSEFLTMEDQMYEDHFHIARAGL
jgi:bifunctional NMN adenylyltransferase/nudix hydrolase